MAYRTHNCLATPQLGRLSSSMACQTSLESEDTIELCIKGLGRAAGGWLETGPSNILKGDTEANGQR